MRRAQNERSHRVDDAIALIRSSFAAWQLDVQPARWEDASHGVLGYEVRNRAGTIVATATGKGGDKQSVASGLFEAWEHYWCYYALDEIRDTDRARALSIGEILDQPAVAQDTMLHRLAHDFPAAIVGCLRFDPVTPTGESIWYPAFAKNPAFRRYVIPGDNRTYKPYDRYATTNGTAAGMSVDEALLHGLLEVIERDALSFALISWYASKNPQAIRMPIRNLPRDLAQLVDSVGSIFGTAPAIMDITTDLRIPVFCALPPSSLFPHANNFGAGASLSPAYAAERAIHELAQFTVVGRDPEYLENHRRTMERLAGWPLIARCTGQEPSVPIEVAKPCNTEIIDWDPPAKRISEQLAEICQRLAGHGYSAYSLRWDPGTPIPVVCVLVPGLETFFLARQGVPVLPTGRATRLLVH